MRLVIFLIMPILLGGLSGCAKPDQTAETKELTELQCTELIKNMTLNSWLAPVSQVEWEGETYNVPDACKVRIRNQMYR
jgi:hypothetical protein